MSFIAWLRRRGLEENERLGINLQINLPAWGEDRKGRVLSVIMLVVVLAALGTLGYAIATYDSGEAYTKFYLLGQGGRATDYPEEIILGEDAGVVVGIVNEELEATIYRVEVAINGGIVNEVEAISLEQGEKWEQEVSFTPELVGDNQEVEFLLYKLSQSEPYRSLLLRVDVIER